MREIHWMRKRWEVHAPDMIDCIRAHAAILETFSVNVHFETHVRADFLEFICRGYNISDLDHTLVVVQALVKVPIRVVKNPYTIWWGMLVDVFAQLDHAAYSGVPHPELRGHWRTVK